MIIRYTIRIGSSPARAQGGEPVLRPGPVLKAATVLYAGVWVYAVFFPKGAVVAGTAGTMRPALAISAGPQVRHLAYPVPD